ncbi:hypothetical protein EXIGLDRAFT_840421 [Exidia glandulosa HHB12029]|uniref:Mak10-domain-containing protein n=1 Tax=Exidia glandulosa HHB12029 TaxID=1314781 RepID=A0A165EG59_EXIGL|nr:hypothetical protein EXIGLDRAFT_840421 [Exidia glandulosa HHB12029]
MSAGLPLPGGSGFIDIHGLIEDATDGQEIPLQPSSPLLTAPGISEMAASELILMDSFGLQDAMSAIEIMDERMDSGAQPPQADFDSNSLLLPEEVCWILDRSFAAEMTWHAGHSLAQSVLTLRYVHLLPRLHPDVFYNNRRDSERRPELITTVLRAGVLGLVKCVDLAWREMSKNNIYDGEDWHSEKFEVSLCEGIAVATIVDLLDEAIEWLQLAKKMTRQPFESPSRSKAQWYTLLIQRLELRRVVLLALSRTLPSEVDDLRSLSLDAQGMLRVIMQGPKPAPPPSTSPAHLAFDPHVCSTLTVLMPVKVIELLDDRETWNSVYGLLDGLVDLANMCNCERLASWRTLARLKAWTPDDTRRTAFLRAISMSAFMSGNLVLGKYQAPWIVDHYFLEMARVPHATLMRLYENDIISPPPGAAPTVLQDFENDMIIGLRDYVYSFFHNRARQRRKLSNALLDMHQFRALAAACARQVRARLGPNSVEASHVKRIELVLHALRLSSIVEVNLSGFDLSLYSRDEMAFIYWYTASVLSMHAAVLREILGHLRMDHTNDRSASDNASTELDLVSGLHAACLGSMLILRLLPPHASHQTPERFRINVERRCKWAYEPGYASIPVKDQVKPDLEAYFSAPEHSLQGVELMTAAQQLFDSAAEFFAHVRLREPHETGSELCADAYQDFMQRLIDVCMANAGFFRIAQTHEDPQRRLQWEIKQDGWLQRITGFSVVAPPAES